MGIQPGQVVIAEGYILSENLLEIFLDKVDRLDIFFVSIKNDSLLHIQFRPLKHSLNLNNLRSCAESMRLSFEF